MLPEAPASFSSDGQFAHCRPPTPVRLTMSVCCKCGEYICASACEPLIHFVERLHRCPGRLVDWSDGASGADRSYWDK